MGADVILDFVGEGGAVEQGIAMLRRAGSYSSLATGAPCRSRDRHHLN